MSLLQANRPLFGIWLVAQYVPLAVQKWPKILYIYKQVSVCIKGQGQVAYKAACN